MPRLKTRSGKVSPLKSRRKRDDLYKFRSRFWNAQRSGMRRTALIGFALGVILGCLFGLMMDVRPTAGDKEQPEMLSVNARTGKPQLHIKGKPEIK